LGDVSKFPADIVKKVNEYLGRPGPKEKRINVNIALNYGGRDELVRAFKKIIRDRKLEEEITPQLISDYLDTSGQPDVDLMIRTGGEQRTSGYLLWQLNYAEMYFTKTYFPDFDVEKFRQALEDYENRDRRFGGDSKGKN
jgi:undecaprenyl diphosphate synthase